VINNSFLSCKCWPILWNIKKLLKKRLIICTLPEKIETVKAHLAEYFSEREIVELTTSISLMGALNRLRITLGDKA